MACLTGAGAEGILTIFQALPQFFEGTLAAYDFRHSGTSPAPMPFVDKDPAPHILGFARPKDSPYQEMVMATALTEEGTSKTVEAGGMTVHYHEAGQGDPVIFLPSGPSSVPSSAWINYHKVLPSLSQHFRCIAMDLVNYGKTGPLVFHEPGHHVQARTAIALMDVLGIQKAHVVGNSVGGTTTVVLALNYPDRVNRIVVGACHASTGGDPYLIANRPVEIGRVAREFTENPTPENMRRYMRTTIDSEALVTDDLVDYMHQLYTTHPEHLEARRKSVQVSHSNLADLPNIKAPTLIIHGRYDRMVPVEVGLAILNYVPDSRLVVFNNCGSWPPFECPEEYAAQVMGFLRG